MPPLLTPHSPTYKLWGLRKVLKHDPWLLSVALGIDRDMWYVCTSAWARAWELWGPISCGCGGWDAMTGGLTAPTSSLHRYGGGKGGGQHSATGNKYEITQTLPTSGDISNDDGFLDETDKQSSPYEKKKNCPFIQAGQYLMRCHHISVSIKNLLIVAEAQLSLENALRQLHMDEQIKTRYKDWSAAVMTFCPKLETCLRQGETKYLSVALKGGMRSARSGDAHRLKELTGRFASEVTGTQIVLSPDSKSDRGFNHNNLGRLLILVQHIKAYDRDPTGIRELVNARDEQYKVTAHYPPAFLYEDPTKYNPDDVLQGFMRGYFLIWCCRTIFIGPKSGLHGPSTMATPTRTGVAGIYGLLTITVPMIVYSATQARFALSAQQTWTGKEHHFDYEEFFETLLQVFELDNDWCKETLSWWNEQIFGHTDGLAPLGPTQGETSDGILARAKIQAAMRHTAKSLANLAVVERAAAEEQYREITPLIDPLEDKSSDNETAPPSHHRTASTVGAPDGGGDGSGKEHDRVGTQRSQK
ncbi:hypothetical protein BJY52DRAFT_1420586 [Lactarius psammicola]|nr:hypothetical protein BJY52DRAFT_1420586 [Lactarius psammicola]